MGLTLQQQLCLLKNLLSTRILTDGTRPSKISTDTEPLYSMYSGVSASVLWYFSTIGDSPVLDGIWFTRTAGFWPLSSIPDDFVPTHIKLVTESGKWTSALDDNLRVHLTAWWAKEQEVNHITLAAAAQQTDTGFWRGDVQSVGIGGTVTEGSNSSTSTVTLDRIGEVPIDPAPDVAGTILLPIPDDIDMGRWGSLVIAPWFDFAAVDYSYIDGSTTHPSHYIGGTGRVAVNFTKETPSAPAYDTLVPENRGWSPTVSLCGYFA